MSYQKQSFGMMDQGYFVSRGQIVDWINNLLHLSITKIEQLGSGAVYCQIVDVIHPGKVAMNKVNWKAKSEYEFINNLKILQSAFDKAGIKRYVEVQKLAKAKYQDNLQFIQWLKRYYDLNCGDRGSSYNPQERRGSNAADFTFAEKNVVPKSFNSGGQIIAKTEIPGRKVTQNIPNRNSLPKIQEQITKKVQQPKVSVKPKQSEKMKMDWEAMYKNQAKQHSQLKLKFQMIAQILISKEDSQTKFAILNELVGINSQENHQISQELHEIHDDDENI